MNILSKLIDLNINSSLTTESIEKKLDEINIKPLRWAIVKVDGSCVTISIAYESL